MGFGSDNPVWKVELSANGSRVAVETENNIVYLDNSGRVLWTSSGSSGVNGTSSGSGSLGMDMAPDGSLVVAPIGDNITAFNGQGKILWSYPTNGTGDSTGDVALALNGTFVWAGMSESGYNGSLYFLNRQGDLLWQKPIYSPALSIQTGDNLTAFVLTNWGALLYGADGSLLGNITSSAGNSTSSGCSPLPNFWYWSGNEAPVAFIDAEGNVVSSYNPNGYTNGYTNGAVLSADGHYALISSSSGTSEYILTLVFLGNGNSQDCPHP